MAGRGKKSAVYGIITDQRGTGSLAEVLGPTSLGDKSGYEPQILDPIIQQLLDNADSGARMVQQYTPMLHALMDRLNAEIQVLLATIPSTQVIQDGSEVIAPKMSDALQLVLGLADKASIIIDRLTKMNNNATKSVDDASRLRTFLATGDEDDGGLKNMGENQLRKLIIDAAQGIMKVDA